MSRAHPVICTECGRAHTSHASMRRTRRRYRLLWVALLLWGLGHLAGVMPRVQRSGWAHAIPGPVLVLSFPLLSEEPGSAMSFQAKTLGTNAYGEMLLDHLSRDHATLPVSRERFGWLSRRMVFWLARHESVETLTDSSAAKGNVYSYVIDRLVGSDLATEGEAAWARTVAHIEFEHPERVASGVMAYGTFRVRRLLQGQYQIAVGSNNAMHRCYTPKRAALGRVKAPGVVEDMGPYYIEAMQWDTVYPIDEAGGLVHREDAVVLGLVRGDAEQGGYSTVQIGFLDNMADYRDPDRWERVGTRYERLELVIDEALRTPEDSSQALREEIESAFRAHLGVEYSRGRGRWVPVVELKPRFRSRLGKVDSLLLSGQLRVELISTFSRDPGARGFRVLESDDCVWRWKPEPGRGRYRMRGRSLDPSRLAGEVAFTGTLITRQVRDSYDVRVVLSPRTARIGRDLAGFEGDRLFTGELVFELENWTSEELCQLVVNGIAPDHALQ